MVLPSSRPRRGPAERALAWVLTGPLGHLWSATADIAVFGARRLAEFRPTASRRGPPKRLS